MNCETVTTYSNFDHPLYYYEPSTLANVSEKINFRLLLIEEGFGTICFADWSFNFSAPTLFCFNERDLPIFKDCKNIKIKCIYFYPRLINPSFNYENIKCVDNFTFIEQQDCFLLLPFLHRDNYYKGQFSIEQNTFIRVSKLFDFIGRELQQQRDCYWPCRSRSYLLELLILTTKFYDSYQEHLEENPQDMPENVSNIITYLQNNYKEKITLEQLATLFTTNRTTLNAQFYKATNLSIIEYLIKLRVNLAETMLRDTLIPISEIMDRVGFNNSSHFWRTFKKHNSLSPKEYRDKYCWVKD